MQLRKLVLYHFRSYEKKEYTFSSSLNCIEGENGTGKSNLLEAIYLLSTGRSFRTHKLSPLIKHGSTQFALKAYYERGGAEHSTLLSFGPEGRRLVCDEKKHTSFLPLLGRLPSVLLSPEDISIFSGGPSERRRFLDIHLSQVDPLYLLSLGRYQRALKGRNLQLKKRQPKGIGAWEEIMAETAVYLTLKRQELIKELSPLAEELVLFLSEEKEPFSISYENTAKAFSKEEFKSCFASSRTKELETGTTLSGPHRDEVHFSLKDTPLKTYGSEGQKRCCLAALRLAEWKRLKTILEISPLFGIDDFGVHLDANRSARLQQALTGMEQVFLTAPAFQERSHGHFLFTTQKDAENKLALEGSP